MHLCEDEHVENDENSLVHKMIQISDEEKNPEIFLKKKGKWSYLSISKVSI